MPSPPSAPPARRNGVLVLRSVVPSHANGAGTNGSKCPAEEREAPDPAVSAAEAGLRYVSDQEPGIRRARCGRGFTYRDPDGETIRDRAMRKRFKALAIPPAWTDVWICPDPHGHIQVTGRDAQNRKQYRYHPRWIEVRNATKFSRMVAFGRALPAIRRRVQADLAREGMPRERVLAAVVGLLESTCIRVGNEDYRRLNGSYGLTTLRRKHVRMEGRRIVFRFRAKGGHEREVRLTDPGLAQIVRECQEIPGHELFQYIDDEGDRWTVDSADVNEYLRAIGLRSFTAKDFRTWMGSVHALGALRRAGPGDTQRETDRRLLSAVDEVAEHLKNTRTVCREFYIHPLLMQAYSEGWLHRALEEIEPVSSEELAEDERLLLALLERHGHVPAVNSPAPPEV